MKFSESFHKPKKTETEVDAEYTAAHDEFRSAVEDMNKAHDELATAKHDAEQIKLRAKEFFERSLKEVEDLNS